jgi:hypothetical protein
VNISTEKTKGMMLKGILPVRTKTIIDVDDDNGDDNDGDDDDDHDNIVIPRLTNEPANEFFG